jgi:outer membrane protein assembly factor BamB
LPPTAEGRGAALLQAPRGVTAVDALTGKVLWDYEALCDAISSPVVAGRRIYLPSNGVTALDLDDPARKPQLAWESPRIHPGAGSVAVHDGRVYVVNGSGVLVCGDAETGDVLWQLRLEGRCWATPIVTDDCVYALNSDGKMFAVQLGEKGKIIGRSDFGVVIQGTPAIEGNAIFVRSDAHLWKIEAPGQ